MKEFSLLLLTIISLSLYSCSEDEKRSTYQENKPMFQVANGTLIKYNTPSPDPETVILPNRIIAIADHVFQGANVLLWKVHT